VPQLDPGDLGESGRGLGPGKRGPGPLQRLDHHPHGDAPATAAASASISGRYGTAAYVISVSSRDASPTSSTSALAVARTGTARLRGPLHTISTRTGSAAWARPAAMPRR